MKYNKEQQQAIEAPEDTVTLIAVVGSGKTHALVGAVQHYSIANPNDRIAVITFTRKAAAEVTRRLKNSHITSCTIHAWCLRELSKLGIKHKFKVELMEDADIQKVLDLICKQNGIYSINKYLLFYYVTGSYNMDIAESTQRLFDRVNQMYIRHKRDNGLYDFMDLPLYLLTMLKKYNETVDSYDALFVDEFQDVDSEQEEIFSLTNTKKKFIVGDPHQSIYQWRGASREVLERTIEERGFTPYTLLNNYRSYQEILDFATTIHTTAPTSLLDIDSTIPSNMIAVRGKGGKVHTVGLHGVWDVVAQKKGPRIEHFLTEVLKRKPYILCRSNKDVKALKTSGYEHISTIHLAKGLEYKDVIVVDYDIRGTEEINIAYVACTRARDTLTICHFNVLMDVMRGIKWIQEQEKLF